MMKPETLKEALASGYTLADTKLQRGYISRRINEEKAPVRIAGGTRKGELYVLLPCTTSSQYCIRQYLREVIA